MADIAIKGSNVILFIHDGSSYLPIGCLTSNSTSESVETNTGTVTKCDLNPAPVLGAYSYTKNFEAEAIEDVNTKLSVEAAQDLMRTKVAAKESVFWKEVITYADASTNETFGEAFLTELSMDAPADGMVTFSGTLSGIGNISDTDLSTTTTTTSV